MRLAWLGLMVLGVGVPLWGDGYGPIFGMATPTNAKGTWRVNLSTLGRTGQDTAGAVSRMLLGYGLTQDVTVQVSAPVVWSPVRLSVARAAAFSPAGSDFELGARWRFHRVNDGMGRRIESTLFGSALIPGPQVADRVLTREDFRPGFLLGVTSGIVTRGFYIWGGVSYQRYLASSNGDQRPQQLFGSFVYGYRPKSWRTDYPRWDWRLFGELTAERTGAVRLQDVTLQRSVTNQIFAGPTLTGTYKSYTVYGGLQLPLYRDRYPGLARERLRYAFGLAYFF